MLCTKIGVGHNCTRINLGAQTCLILSCKNDPQPLNSLQEYYKSKGNRPTTRPPPGGGGEEGEEEVWESFEQCLDALIERCHCYQQQAEAYRNDCIDGESAVLLQPALCRVKLLLNCLQSYTLSWPR